jgi:hypothetical protein
MALDVDPWLIKALDKLRRGFMSAGREEAHGGNCLVAWAHQSALEGWGCTT